MNKEKIKEKEEKIKEKEELKKKLKKKDNKKLFIITIVLCVWITIMIIEMPFIINIMFGAYITNVPAMASAFMITSVIATLELCLLVWVFAWAGQWIYVTFKHKLTGKDVFFMLNPNGRLRPRFAQEQVGGKYADLSESESVEIERGTEILAPGNIRAFLCMPEYEKTISPLQILEKLNPLLGMIGLRMYGKFHTVKEWEKNKDKEKTRGEIPWVQLGVFMSIILISGMIAYQQISRINYEGQLKEEIRQCIVGEGSYEYLIDERIKKAEPSKVRVSNTGAGLS